MNAAISPSAEALRIDSVGDNGAKRGKVALGKCLADRLIAPVLGCLVCHVALEGLVGPVCQITEQGRINGTQFRRHRIAEAGAHRTNYRRQMRGKAPVSYT